MSFAQNTPIQFIPGIGPRTADVLHRLGVHTAVQFTRVPEQMLIELFGPSIRRVSESVSVRSAASTHHCVRIAAPTQTKHRSFSSRDRSSSFLKKMKMGLALMVML